MTVPRSLALCTALVLLSACSHWSWNPFHKEPPPPPPPVDLLSIQSLSADPARDRFTQSWQGARLVVDIYSDAGIGRAVVKPRAQGWPQRLAFRVHLSALEGFEIHGAENMRISLGHDPLTEPPLIDVPHGAYTKDSAQLEVQWVDHYR